MSKITFNAVEAAYIYSWYLKRPVFNSQEENETKIADKIRKYILEENRKEMERDDRNIRNTHGSYR